MFKAVCCILYVRKWTVRVYINAHPLVLKKEGAETSFPYAVVLRLKIFHAIGFGLMILSTSAAIKDPTSRMEAIREMCSPQ